MNDPLVNKVTESGLITINLEDYFPKEEMRVFDLKDFLFMGLILKEKDYRESLKTHDWSQYEGMRVAVTCTADAIIPVWAYMLAATYLQPVAKDILVGTKEEMVRSAFFKNLADIDTKEFEDKRIVIKGCGDIEIGDYAYMELTKLLMPVAKSIMYGEPCSTVPVFKKK